MSRIRSIHPGFYTDEALVSVSMAARLLFPGLGIEADDKGVFEWKPITLKMRLFPVDNVNVAELLAELEAVNAIRSYEMNGRKYGAIRNFRIHQRPKTPNDIHPIPDDFRNYVGLSPTVSPPLPPKGEKSPQMEDGGWSKEGEREKEEVDAAEAASGSFAFTGITIRLTEFDLARWRKTYSAIQDLEAELTSIDAWFQANPPKLGKWFHAAAGMLNRKHQEILKADQDRPKRPRVPL